MNRTSLGQLMTGVTDGLDAVACADLDGTPIAAVIGGDEMVHICNLHSGELIGLIGAKGVRSVTGTADGHLVLGMGRDLAVFTWRPRYTR